ncbi:MAG: integrase domain-containing protein [Humidesulfovibrio sp.]|nr:integrase domain-containing protein [Humidesulfovibrio sp.]
MAGKQDPLLYALGRARLTGSRKTQYNHRLEARRFVMTLREFGNGVAKWANITNKHVAAVVAQWRADGLSLGTIKNNLAGVRAVCMTYGNEAIASSNSAFGVGRRAYITNVNRAVADVEFERVTGHLCASGNPQSDRVALMLGFQREFGMRLEESMKFNPLRDVGGNLVHIHVGTKGGRPRWLVIRTAGQRELLDAAKTSGFYRDLRHGIIPERCREEQWRGFVYRTVRQASFETGGTGLRMHGLRHAYAHKRYEELTGFLPPCRYDSRESYHAAAMKAAGQDWRERDELARCTIREELGHSPDRVDIDAQYLGKR